MRLLVCGGGTGGHLFPGIAVADAVLAAEDGSEVYFVCTDRPTDRRVLSSCPFKVSPLACGGLKGKSPFALIRSLFKLPWALIRSMVMVFRFRPDLVLGVGGYVTGPVLLAARMMGVKTCLHEQNSVPGLANRIAGHFVDRVFISFPGSSSFFPPGKCLVTGNPVRKKILKLAASQNESKEENGFTLLVLGGSLGARVLNSLVLDALGVLNSQLPPGFKVIHQTGPLDEDGVRGNYNRYGIEAEVRGFFDDMAAIYRQGDLVVARAGAGTLAELAIVGKPMILVPYPHAADNHQVVNAGYLVQGGAGIMLNQQDLTGGKLAGELARLIFSQEDRMKMAKSAQGLAQPEAVEMIVEQCQRLAGNKNV